MLMYNGTIKRLDLRGNGLGNDGEPLPDCTSVRRNLAAQARCRCSAAESARHGHASLCLLLFPVPARRRHVVLPQLRRAHQGLPRIHSCVPRHWCISQCCWGNEERP